MAKKPKKPKDPIFPVSRKSVENDIQIEEKKGKSRIAAVLCVMGDAADKIKQAKKDIETMVRKAKGFENFNDDQNEKYDKICRTIFEPEYQRIGHCKNILAELGAPQ